MKAVNLIPDELRRNVSVRGRSGGGAYAFLGALVVLIALVMAYTVAGRAVADKRTELTDTKARADKIAGQVQALEVYTKFADLKQKRTETVASIARSRFDWARSLRELSRTLPAGVSLGGVSATISPTATADGGATDPLRGALPDPAFVLQGCARTQNLVAATMAEFRRMEGVERVSLSASQKGDGAATPVDCAGPKFSLVIFFKPVAVAAAAAPSTTPAATTPAATTPTPTGASK